MMELTDDQIRLLNTSSGSPPRARNPHSNETFVLLRVEEYDDSPWTPEELQALAWETGKGIGWEEMDDYDRLPEKP